MFLHRVLQFAGDFSRAVRFLYRIAGRGGLQGSLGQSRFIGATFQDDLPSFLKEIVLHVKFHLVLAGQTNASAINMYASYENTTLLQLLAKDDEKAFTALYHRYWKKLFAVAYNRLPEVETAEDIVHDVFAGLWCNRRKLAVEALENYLATATKYLVLAKIKSKIKERSFAATVDRMSVLEPPFEASLHYKQVLALVQQEVERLPEKCRLVFECSRQEGLTAKQIAGHFQLSQKTVENQLNKALKRLKPLGRTFLTLLLVSFSWWLR